MRPVNACQHRPRAPLARGRPLAPRCRSIWSSFGPMTYISIGIGRGPRELGARGRRQPVARGVPGTGGALVKPPAHPETPKRQRLDEGGGTRARLERATGRGDRGQLIAFCSMTSRSDRARRQEASGKYFLFSSTESPVPQQGCALGSHQGRGNLTPAKWSPGDAASARWERRPAWPTTRTARSHPTSAPRMSPGASTILPRARSLNSRATVEQNQSCPAQRSTRARLSIVTQTLKSR